MAKRKPEPTKTERYLEEQRVKAAGDIVAAQTALNKAKFLDAFAGTGNVSAAAKLAQISRRTHYDWMEDPAYAVVFAESVDEAADRLETEARRRAVSGIVEPVFHKGVQIGTTKKYSDTLLIFLLKGARPEKYAERHKHSGTGKGGAVLLETLVAGPEPAAASHV